MARMSYASGSGRRKDFGGGFSPRMEGKRKAEDAKATAKARELGKEEREQQLGGSLACEAGLGIGGSLNSETFQGGMVSREK